MKRQIASDLSEAAYAANLMRMGLEPDQLEPATKRAMRRLARRLLHRSKGDETAVGQILTAEEKREIESRFDPTDLVAMNVRVATALRLECFITLIRRTEDD